MSFHDHDPEYYMRVAKREVNKRPKKDSNETSGYSDVQRVKSFVEVFEMANKLNVRSFIQWCDKEDWCFEKPIKHPSLNENNQVE